MKIDLGNNVAVVTGAGQGLGRAIASLLAEAGAAVVATDRDPALLAASAEDGAYGDNHILVEADVADEAQVDALFKTAAGRFQRVDILVNNAGVTTSGSLEDVSRSVWDRQIAVNATGTFLCTQAAGRLMRARGYGRIVNLSSHSGSLGSNKRAAYAASKGAVNAFTRVAAVELAAFGVTVNAVAPGPVQTPHAAATHTAERIRAWHDALPIKRYATPEEIGALVVFLASRQAGYITGQTIAVDGGFTIAGLIEA